METLASASTHRPVIYKTQDNNCAGRGFVYQPRRVRAGRPLSVPFKIAGPEAVGIAGRIDDLGVLHRDGLQLPSPGLAYGTCTAVPLPSLAPGPPGTGPRSKRSDVDLEASVGGACGGRVGLAWEGRKKAELWRWPRWHASAYAPGMGASNTALTPRIQKPNSCPVRQGVTLASSSSLYSSSSFTDDGVAYEYEQGGKSLFAKGGDGRRLEILGTTSSCCVLQYLNAV
ncbi:uncharacterized protein PSFLO_02690 [Pseudozyma flocculosa]|uniref:Uncharacterized protein n=1 Tax=Pseudozyma flocculosa TaxID=84751 RepID=A0A5C3EYB0_9BASI|nr:uncharacterized protein PSFLO_02690 [Pseudozyma flocculosa]